MANSDPVQSVSRAVEILDLASASAEGVALRDLAQALAVSPAAAHNLARTLVLKGYLQRREDPPRYLVGPALLQAAQRHSHRDFLQQTAAALVTLARKYPRATVTLSEVLGSGQVDGGGDVVTVLRLSPERPGILQRPTGLRMGAYTSASCLCVQAFWTQEERNDFARRWPFDEFAAPTWSTPKRLAAYLAQVRKTGFALLPFTGARQSSERMVRVAVPVFERGLTLRATLGTAWAGGVAAVPGVVKSLQAAASQLQNPKAESGQQSDLQV